MELEEDVGDLSQGPGKAKDSKIKKKDCVKGKKSDPVFTRGLGSQLKRRKT